jgi:hypothetical protein
MLGANLPAFPLVFKNKERHLFTMPGTNKTTFFTFVHKLFILVSFQLFKVVIDLYPPF